MANSTKRAPVNTTVSDSLSYSSASSVLSVSPNLLVWKIPKVHALFWQLWPTCWILWQCIIIIIIITIIIIINPLCLLHFSLFSTAFWDLPKSRPVHSLMLSSLPLPLATLSSSPFHCALQDVLARPDEQETWPYHYSLRLFMIVRRSFCGPIACGILAKTSALVTWSLYEMCSILQ